MRALRRAVLLASTALVLPVFIAPAFAVDVANEAQLRDAIFAANTGGDTTINLTSNITLTQSLPMMSSNITVNGGGSTIDANNAGRVFFVESGSVAINGVTVANARAQGGAGAAGGDLNSLGGGGGGGLGAGAALFVNQGATLTVSNVRVQSAASAGGAGGFGDNSGGGGGGGLGGNGGSAVSFNYSGAGGGGYAGSGGAGEGGGGGGGGEFAAGGLGSSNGGGGGGGGQRGAGGAGFQGGGGGGGATAAGGNSPGVNGGTGGGAQGGAGGDANAPATGANGTAGGGGGGGGLNDGVAAGNGGRSGGGGGGGATTAGNSGGGNGGTGGGGGGGGSNDSNGNGVGGNGGAFGGGGGGQAYASSTVNNSGGNGGYGGGGGGGGLTNTTATKGGDGGFGAGGGGGYTIGPPSAVGAGGEFGGAGGLHVTAGGLGGGGGGGAALGGAIFVADGGTLVFADGDISGTHSVTAGVAGTGGTDGQALGSLMFMHGASTTNFNIGTGNTVTTAAGDSIDGAGALTKSGAGTLVLGGTNTYTGNTSVDGGILAVNGSIVSAVTVNNGGTLGGTGTVTNNTTVTSGGTLAPGNSIGIITLNGNLSFNAGANYAVEYSPTDADRTNVSGTATLTGATVRAIALPGSFTPRSYTILNAIGGVIGRFDGVVRSGATVNAQASRASLDYDANNVYLLLSAGSIDLPPGTSGNAASVAGGINNAVLGGATVPVAFDALLNLNGAALENALLQASGQPGASTAQTGFTAMNQFSNAVFDSAFDDDRAGQGGPSGYAPERNVSHDARNAYAAVTPRDRRTPTFEQRWNVWASAYGGNSRVNGDAVAGTSTTTSRIFGTVVGTSYRLSPQTQIGFALGGAGTTFGLDGGFGGGKADVFNAAIYGKHNFGAAYIAGLLGYSWQDTTTDRTVTIAGTDQLHAAFKTQALTARLEGGWRYATPMVGITPYAALQSSTFYLPSYGETATSGSGVFALNYASQSITATRSELGAKLDKAMLVQGGVVTLKAKAAWAHDWNTDRNATAIFQTLPGSTFTVSGAQPAADAALLSLGGTMNWHNGWSVSASFDGEFSRATTGYAGKGAIKYAW